MLNDHIAAAHGSGQATGGRERSPSLYREIGLAAVAIELHLQLNTLDPDVAEAVERGRAALFPAAYELGPSRCPRNVRVGEEGRRRKARRGASKARRSLRFRKAKAEVVNCLAVGTEARP